MTPEEKVQQMEADAKAAKEKAEALETKYEELQKKNEVTEAELKAAKEAAEKAAKESSVKFEKLQEGLDDLTKKMDLQGETTIEEKSIVEAISEVLGSEEFKNDLKSGSLDKKEGKTYELKASTANFTVPVTTTQMKPGVSFPRDRQLAFVSNLMPGTVGQDKARIGWIEGTYTSNVGYVGEGKRNATEDTISTIERYRSMAKASARMKVTKEMFEDTNFIASRINNKMLTKGMLFLDNEIYSGDGNDSTAQNHIYGLKGVATPFDATKAGVATTVEKANVADLIGAMKLQARVTDASDAAQKNAGGYALDVVYLHPVTAYKYAHMKNDLGDYLITTLADGTQVLNGLRVVETPAVGVTEAFAMESQVAELYFKRNPEIKVGQEEDDLSTDRYTIVLFLRAQVVAEAEDVKGMIYVADVDTAIAAITKA